MIIYEVHVEIEPRHLDTFENYMRREHLPAILATGCFRRITFERETPTHFRTRYEADTRDDVDRYLAQHTAEFRADFQERYPDGVRVWRDIWDVLECFARD
jgi:hypothetical protein